MFYTTLAIVFSIGFYLAFFLVNKTWKNNAKKYTSINGYKVIEDEFYDHEILSKYQGYLQKQKLGIHNSCAQQVID